MKKILVLAGNYNIFYNWCKTTRQDPKSNNVVYIHRANQLYGLDPKNIEKIVRTCKSYTIPSIIEILAIINNYGFPTPVWEPCLDGCQQR